MEAPNEAVISVLAGWIAVVVMAALKRIAPGVVATSNLRQLITVVAMCVLTVGFRRNWTLDWSTLQELVVMFASATASYRWVVKPIAEERRADRNP